MSELIPSPAKTFAVSVEELSKLVSKYTPTPITTPEQADEAKQEYREIVKIRTSITTAGKQGRDASNAYNKAVLSLEKTLLAEVIPTEEAFKKELDAYEEHLRIEAQLKKLPDRISACHTYFVDYEEDQIKGLSDDQFHQFIIDGQAKRLRSMMSLTATDAYVDTTTNPGFKVSTSFSEPEPLPPMESREYRDWLKENEYSPTTHFLTNENNQCTLWKKVSTFNF